MRRLDQAWFLLHDGNVAGHVNARHAAVGAGCAERGRTGVIDRVPYDLHATARAAEIAEQLDVLAREIEGSRKTGRSRTVECLIGIGHRPVTEKEYSRISSGCWCRKSQRGVAIDLHRGIVGKVERHTVAADRGVRIDLERAAGNDIDTRLDRDVAAKGEAVAIAAGRQDAIGR